MSSSSIKLLFNAPAIQKRSISKEDIPPKHNKNQETDKNIIICAVCTVNEARYTCPKCELPYCGIACYRIHDLPPKMRIQNGDNSNNKQQRGGVCTEAFYKNRVVDTMKELNLTTTNEKEDAILQMTTTTKEQSSSIGRNCENDDSFSLLSLNIAKEGDSKQEQQEHATTNNSKVVNLTNDELLELTNHIKPHSDDDDDDDCEEFIMKNNAIVIPKHIMDKFELAVKRGQVSHLIDQWHPFWLPNYSSIKEDEKEEDEEDFPSTFVLDSQQQNLLDDRILLIQPFTKLRPSIQQQQQQIPPPLEYNMIEILYTTVNTLRMYNGFQQSNDDTNHMAAIALYKSCKVLSHDERYGSIAEVIMTHNYKNARILVKDVICICKWKRLMLRVLLMTTVELFNTGYTIQKHHYKNHAKNIANNNVTKRDFKKAQKKVEYYASWCIEYWDSIQNQILEELEQWQHDWKVEKDNDDDDIVLDIGSSSTAININSTNKRKSQQDFDKTCSFKSISTRKL